MSEYLKIKGLGSIVLVGDVPIAERDYLVAIRCALSSINNNVEDIENPRQTYILRYINTENVMECGTQKKIEVQKGKTPSQILRWILEDYAFQLGKDKDEFYAEEMKRIADYYRKKLK